MSDADAERLRDELARQHRILRGEVVPRLLLVGLAYAICAQFVAPWIMIALFLVEVGGEAVSQRLLRGLDPLRSPLRSCKARACS